MSFHRPSRSTGAAAYQPNGKEAAVLRCFSEYLEEGMVDRMKDVLAGALNAVRVVRKPKAKGEATEYIAVPDYPVQLLATQIILRAAFVEPAKSLKIEGGGEPPGTQESTADFARKLFGNWAKMKEIGDQYAAAMEKAKPIEVR